jgi:hypothetical protein
LRSLDDYVLRAKCLETLQRHRYHVSVSEIEARQSS